MNIHEQYKHALSKSNDMLQRKHRLAQHIKTSAELNMQKGIPTYDLMTYAQQSMRLDEAHARIQGRLDMLQKLIDAEAAKINSGDGDMYPKVKQHVKEGWTLEAEHDGENYNVFIQHGDFYSSLTFAMSTDYVENDTTMKRKKVPMYVLNAAEQLSMDLWNEVNS